MSGSNSLPITASELIDSLFLKETKKNIVYSKSGPKGEDRNKWKFQGHNTSADAKNTIIKDREDEFLKKYYDTLIRPLLNLVRANPDSKWADLTTGTSNIDDETGEPGLGYLHQSFQSILQYKKTNRENFRYLKSIKALISDLHSYYEEETKQIPTQGEGLPIAIIDNYKGIIFTTTPPLDLLMNWQIGVTFINIAREYSIWPSYWSLLSHEVCGHEIINGYYNTWTDNNPITSEIYKKINEEFAGRVANRHRTGDYKQIDDDRVSIAFGSFACDYWTDQQIFQETLASIMAYLNMGPAYGIALYSILQPLMMRLYCLYDLKSLLKMPEQDHLPYGLHPIPVLHMVIAQQCMRKFSSRQAGRVFNAWANFFKKLADVEKGENKLFILSKEDLNSEKLIIPRDRMVRSVEKIVDIVVDSPLESLERNSIADYFYCWGSSDEQQTRPLVRKLQRESFKSESAKSLRLLKNGDIKARHIVAAATIATANARDLGQIKQINDNAINILAAMHDKQPEAKPLQKRGYLKALLRAAPVELGTALPEFSRLRGFSNLRSL